MEEEKSVWQGSPSQLINSPVFLACALAMGILLGISGMLLYRQTGSSVVAMAIGGAAVIPLLVALWKWVSVRLCRYELTTERLLLTQGVFSRTSQALELYRVKDYMLSEPLYLRIFGLGDIQLTTSDETTPTLLLRAVSGAKGLRDQIRQHVEQCRDKKHVRVAELE